MSLGIQHYLEERKSWPLETITLLGYSKLPTCLIKSITCHISWEHLRTNTPKRCPFHYRDWNAKAGSQEIPGITGNFGFGIQNEAGQGLIEFCQENARVITNTFFNNTREDSTHGHHQMANTEIRLIIFFAAKDGEALYSQQKQDQELTVAQIMNSLLPNSDLN